MADTSSPLSEVVADVQSVDEEKLTNLLRGRVFLDDEAGELRLAPTVQERTVRERIVLCLLGQLGLNVLSSAHARGLKPQRVTEIVNAKGGTVRPALRELTEAGYLTQTESGAYEVPPYALDDIATYLEVDANG